MSRDQFPVGNFATSLNHTMTNEILSPPHASIPSSLPNTPRRRKTFKKNSARFQQDAEFDDKSRDAIKYFPHSVHNISVHRSKYSTSLDDRGFIPVYEYKINEHPIMWDRETGYVHFTGIWKALGKNKADIARLVDTHPDLASSIKKVRGGFLKIQGTWMPFESAQELSRRTCYDLRDQLVPLFGPDFPSQTLHPSQPGFGHLALSDEDVPKKRLRRKPKEALSPDTKTIPMTPEMQPINIILDSKVIEPRTIASPSLSSEPGSPISYISAASTDLSSIHELPPISSVLKTVPSFVGSIPPLNSSNLGNTFGFTPIRFNRGATFESYPYQESYPEAFSLDLRNRLPDVPHSIYQDRSKVHCESKPHNFATQSIDYPYYRKRRNTNYIDPYVELEGRAFKRIKTRKEGELNHANISSRDYSRIINQSALPAKVVEPQRADPFYSPPPSNHPLASNTARMDPLHAADISKGFPPKIPAAISECHQCKQSSSLRSPAGPVHPPNAKMPQPFFERDLHEAIEASTILQQISQDHGTPLTKSVSWPRNFTIGNQEFQFIGCNYRVVRYW